MLYAERSDGQPFRIHHLERTGYFLWNGNKTFGITVMKVPGMMQILAQTLVVVVVVVIVIVIIVVGVVVVVPIMVVGSLSHCRRRRNNNICFRNCNNWSVVFA